MPPYYVIEEQTKDATLLHPVKAKNRAQALATIVEPRFTVRDTDTDELLKLQAAGAKITEAK